MKQIVDIDGREYVVEIRRQNGRNEFRLNGRPVDADVVEVEPGVYSILAGGRSFEVKIEEVSGGIRAHVVGKPYPYEVRIRDPRRSRAAGGFSSEGRQEIVSPMPGKVVRVLVEEKQQVSAGQGLIVVEAMKMQNEIKSPKDGTVTRIAARAGATVNAGETLIVVE